MAPRASGRIIFTRLQALTSGENFDAALAAPLKFFQKYNNAKFG
jgi:hypothetical protein